MPQPFTHQPLLQERALSDEAQTLALGAALCRLLRAGDVIGLMGQLGAGKTTLCRGLITALCGEDEVPSPTYTVVQTYSAKDFDIWHFDLYRIKTPQEVWELGIEEALEGGVSLIEWPQRLEGLWPEGTLDIVLEFEGGARRAKFYGNAAWAARLEAL